MFTLHSRTHFAHNCAHNSLQRDSYNLAVAFQTHKRSILRYMHDLAVGMTNNQGERDLRPVKLHRKISSCFKSQVGAERFASVRSYLSTTRKNDVSALDALTCLFNGDPWMPPEPWPPDKVNGYSSTVGSGGIPLVSFGQPIVGAPIST